MATQVQPDALTAPSPHGAWVTLHNIDWATYQRLREEPSNRRVHMTFDRGTLHLMAPGRLHERIAEILGHLIFAWAEERDVPLSSGGALTVSREDLQRGCEPDKCYFIECEAEARASDEHSLDASDPPPDLVVEVDVSSSSNPRMPIYAALGVSEVWRWRNETIEVFGLGADGQYAQRGESQALPGFPLDEAAHLLQQRRQQSEVALVKQFRQRVRGSDVT